MVLFEKKISPAVVGKIDRTDTNWYVTPYIPNIIPQSILTEPIISKVPTEMA